MLLRLQPPKLILQEIVAEIHAEVTYHFQYNQVNKKFNYRISNKLTGQPMEPFQIHDNYLSGRTLKKQAFLQRNTSPS